MDERDICFGDINDDGKNEIVAAIDKDIFCFSENGETLWKYAHDSRVISCRVQQGTSNGIKVVAGTNDAVLLGLSAGGHLIKSVKIDLKSSSKHGSKVPRG